ncbi:3-dehydrosphinganine reductase [Galdieria sulphuraria]|uniref:3-dehydrosphinganine reductase n=1 Tax=Galdieria sulphuraria TaxID=130081 RepID=M2W815_GALSU|nr:3-dehydrosphinganine reductase [Galdieria sulphuraria]EME31991.1 3-dehydrosphinganine reductase [Galdieria sulphuraria]|eukprot:XP_005708511.1 3-dehydrosphinganine reductase [Galdieria sulphuraria]
MNFYVPLVVVLLCLALFGLLRKVSRKSKLLLKGEHVLITGGTSGIGLEFAKLCLLHGCYVTVVGRSATRLEEALKVLRDLSKRLKGKEPIGYLFDVAEANSCESLLAQAEQKQGPIFLLICCAGSCVPGYFEEMDPNVFESQMRSNYLSAVYPVQSAFKRMKELRRGHIVLTSSIGGLLGVFGYSAYSPSKFAVRGLAEVLYQECLPFGVGVSLVCPPDTKTPGFDNENKHKPRETSLLSQGAGLFSAEQVAKEALNDIISRKFLISVGFQGKMLANGFASSFKGNRKES